MFLSLQKIIQKLLPVWICNRLIRDWTKDGFKKYFFNTGWVFVAKMVSFAVSFLTVAFVARYLGPENYGKLSYAQSFVALFSMFASLGIDQILYRDLIAHPEKEKEILGTAFLSKLVFGVLTLFLTFVSSIIINEDPTLTWLIGIIALTFLFQPFGVISHYFHANVKAKYVSYITIVLAFLIPSLKLLFIFLEKGILYFAALIVFESLVLGVSYLLIYRYVFHKSPLQWRYSFQILKNIFSDSWPLFLVGVSGYIYGRIDQVMIQQLLDSKSVGIYDVAVRLTETWGFFPGIFIVSLFPAIVNARACDYNEYLKRLKVLSLFSLFVSAFIACLVFLVAPVLIDVLFGAQFQESAAILRIYIWSLIGAISVSLIQSYLITENKSKKILYLTIFGAVVNVGLNIILIPMFGIQGAAFTTLIAYISIISLFIISERRKKVKVRKNS